MSNAINVAKNNTLEFSVVVSNISGLESYEATLTVKEYPKSSETKIEVTSTDITDDTITIKVPHEKNNIKAGSYVYGIHISDGTNEYTIDLGDKNDEIPTTFKPYNILPTVKD
ncbi:hypothetical protein [Methanohalobium sp.]|uniref:hypothetical protein n=1 Tax=Methanohalobium sp. TaxID=2837493 RepID=UPI0025D3CC7A|nr:hypothetical protein [Methanohalobium sp.]